VSTILTTPIVQLEFLTENGPVPGPPIAPHVTEAGLAAMRQAYWNGEPWGADGGRIIVMIEDPFRMDGSIR
jgi:hypothetical protein